MTNFPAGTYMLSAPHTPEMVDEAKAYIRRMNLTQEDAILRTEGGQVVVVLRRELKFDDTGKRITSED